MIIDAFSAENTLTFGTFELRLDGKPCTIVGPNGGGKSQIVRLLDLVQKALDSVGAGLRGQRFAEAARQTLQSYASARHHGEPLDRPSTVRLAVRFTTDAECLWILTYFRAAVLYTLLQEMNPGDQSGRVRVAQWIEAEITEDRILSLYSGAIVLQHQGLPHIPWNISYEFTHKGTNYSWVLSSHMPNAIIEASSGFAGLRTIPQGRLADHLLDITSVVKNSLADAIFSEFNFDGFCPPSGTATVAPVLHVGTGLFDQELSPFRAAITTIGVPALPQSQHVFQFGYVLSVLLNDGVIVVGEQLRGLGTGGTPPRQAGPYSWETLASPVRGHAPWELPLRLFELKNSTVSAEKRRFERIQDYFTALAPGRTIDVSFQAIGLGGMNSAPMGAGQTAILGQMNQAETEQSEPGAMITVTVDRINDSGIHPNALPIQLQGAGTWEALVLAEALAEAPDRFLVLDEPAVTLHPSWQRALCTRLKTIEGQVLLITHSADLVAMEDDSDLERIVRLENETGQTRVHRFAAGELDSSEVSRITRDLALSADAVSLLFARGVVLVEGETELGALPKWFVLSAASHDLPRPSELDLAFWSVSGDTHFRTYITVLNALAIPWVLVCDGAAFNIEKRQKRLPHIFDQVLSARVDAPSLRDFLGNLNDKPNLRIMDASVFSRERELGRVYGIFTLAMGWKIRDKETGTPNDESFEVFVEQAAPGELALASQEVGESKVRQGRWIADKVPFPEAVSALYADIVSVLEQRGLRR